MGKRCLKSDVCKARDKTRNECLSVGTVLIAKERCGKRKEAGKPPLLGL